jgi:gamma-polyglutamate biosynthesis protein CapA
LAFHGLRQSGKAEVVNEIKRLRKEVEYLIVAAHWGIEYQTYFHPTQQRLAHEFIDAGADVILGHHPHVIQPIEVYNNKLIFYSLGNFVFDQDFSTETMQGLGVGLVLNPQQITAYLFPVEIQGFQPRLLEFKKSGMLLAKLAQDSLADEATKEQIKQGKIIISP